MNESFYQTNILQESLLIQIPVILVTEKGMSRAQTEVQLQEMGVVLPGQAPGLPLSQLEADEKKVVIIGLNRKMIQAVMPTPIPGETIIVMMNQRQWITTWDFEKVMREINNSGTGEKNGEQGD